MNETEKIKNLLIKTYWQTLVTKFIILTEMKRDRTKELITRLFDALFDIDIDIFDIDV